MHAGGSSLSAIQQALPDGGSAFSLAYDTSYVPPATEGSTLGNIVIKLIACIQTQRSYSAYLMFFSPPDPVLVPLGGLVSSYVHEEDSAAVVANPSYQPYTISFDNASPVHSDMSGGVGGAAAVSAPVGVTLDPVASLVDSLHSGADLRTAIRTWAASTPTDAVRSLSPQSLQRILQSISFSMDQVTVAHELAQVIHCTCAHVVTAVNVCSFFKTEIAAGMVPYVRDAEHKSNVLGLLPTYDREKVEALFVKA